MTKKNFTLRLPDDLREEFMALASEKSRRSGRYIPLSDVLESALRYGKEVVQREICSKLHCQTLQNLEQKRLLL